MRSDPIRADETIEERAQRCVGFMFWLRPDGSTVAVSYKEIIEIIREFELKEKT